MKTGIAFFKEQKNNFFLRGGGEYILGVWTFNFYPRLVISRIF